MAISFVCRQRHQRTDRVQIECPITRVMFVDPVTTPSGITYERTALIEALLRNPTDPLAGSALTIDDCTPSLAMKSICETLRSSASKEVFDLMCTELAAEFTEADLERVHVEMLKKEKAELKTREQFDKAHAP